MSISTELSVHLSEANLEVSIHFLPIPQCWTLRLEADEDRIAVVFFNSLDQIKRFETSLHEAILEQEQVPV